MALQKNNYKSDISGLANTYSDRNVNIYGFLYNVPGYEIPYIAISKQIELIYSNREKLNISSDVVDPNTMNSRIYELSRCL